MSPGARIAPPPVARRSIAANVLGRAPSGGPLVTSVLGRGERALLLVPLAGGATFGAISFFALPSLAALLGYAGTDTYIYRLGGSATLGYAVALGLAIRDGSWAAARWVVLATLVFNVVSIAACVIEIARGRAQPVVYVILVASVLICAITATLLGRHRVPAGPADVAPWTAWTTAVATVAAAVFGILPLFPGTFASLAGYTGADPFVWRQAGAATLGYAAMGVGELVTRRWAEMRLPAAMAAVFNGLAFVASVIELLTRGATILDVLVAPASLLFTVLSVLSIARRGR